MEQLSFEMLNRIFKFTISAFFFIFAGFVKTIRILAGKKIVGPLVILTYHSVQPHQKSRFSDQMDILIREGTPVFADIEGPLPENTHHIAVTFDDGYLSFMENALPNLQKRTIPAILFIPVGYLGKLPGWITNKDHSYYHEKLVSADQLKGLLNNQLKIGSHCVSHPRLTTLDPQQAEKELFESKSILEDLLGKEVTTLSFPYNDFNCDIVHLARQAGYSRVFANVPVYPNSKVEQFLHGRIEVSPEDWSMEYWLKVRGAYQWLSLAIKIKRILVNKLTSKRGVA